MLGILWVISQRKGQCNSFFFCQVWDESVASHDWCCQEMLTNLTVRALLIALNPYFLSKNCIAWLAHSIPFAENCQCQWGLSKFFGWCCLCWDSAAFSFHFSFGFCISDLFVKPFSVLCVSRHSLPKHLIWKLLPVILAKVVLEENLSQLLLLQHVDVRNTSLGLPWRHLFSISPWRIFFASLWIWKWIIERPCDLWTPSKWQEKTELDMEIIPRHNCWMQDWERKVLCNLSAVKVHRRLGTAQLLLLFHETRTSFRPLNISSFLCNIF